MADARDTLLLPFAQGLVPEPDKDWLFFEARPLPGNALSEVQCEQGHRGFHLALQDAGYDTAPQRDAGDRAGTLVLANRNRIANERNLARAWNATREGGHVVFLSSVTYNMVVPYAAYYAASTAFVSSIGRSLRLELEADNIGVTTMVVGRTATNFNRDRLGGSRSGDSVPSMTPDKVAEGIVRGVENNQRQVFMRFFDRLTILGNILVPERIGRIALKDYK